MSSDTAKGAQQQAKIRQKQKPDYFDDAGGVHEITKQSYVDLDLSTSDLRNVNLGLKIRDNQAIEPDGFKIWGRVTATGAWKKMTVTPLTGSDLTEVQRQLNTVSPVTYKDATGTERSTGEKWLAYKLAYDPTKHGFLFKTELTLKPFDYVPKNGFQVVTSAFTYETVKFDEGHYIVGTSILPGEDSDFDHTAFRMKSGRSAAKGKKKKKAKSRKKGKRK